MKNSEWEPLRPVFIVTLLIALAACAPPAASAQAPDENAQFRAKLVEFSAGMEQAIQQTLEQDVAIEPNDPYHLRQRQLLRAARDAFVRARYVMAVASPQDVVRMQAAFAQSPQLMELPRAWSAAMSSEAVAAAAPPKSSAYRNLNTTSACSGGQYTSTSGGALPVYGLDFAWATQFLNMFLNLFTQYPAHQTSTPYPGTIQLIPTFTAYQAGVTGQSQCEQAQALLELLNEMIPDTLVSVSVGVSIGIEVSVGADIPNPIKQGFGVLLSVNKLICLRMALANSLGNDCNLNASFNIIDASIRGISTSMAADIAAHDARLAAHDARLVTHDANMTTQHAGLVNLINGRANAIDAALQAQKEFLERFRVLAVQLALEKNLLDDGNDVMSIFELPAQSSPPGGVDGIGINLVRQVVELAITRGRSAGLPLYHAESELAKGIAAAAASDYRAAFNHYRQAYLNAVK